MSEEIVVLPNSSPGKLLEDRGEERTSFVFGWLGFRPTGAIRPSFLAAVNPSCFE